ncbi:MAG: hypothetical protein ABI839_02535 [Verrucomicrobiota bacterium]
MRRGFTIGLEILFITLLVTATRCANFQDVFVGREIHFLDGDCYARMTRARLCFEHPGTIVRHHDFENYPQGTSPHTTAPLDYLIVALAVILSGISAQPLDLAGAFIAPVLAVAMGAFLCWWTRLMQLRFRWAVLLLYALSPLLAHAFALGRPDHQALAVALVMVALCGEWRLIRGPSRGWSVASGVSWALALWVSLYEPLVLLALTLLLRPVNGSVRGWWREDRQWGAFAFGVIVLCAALMEWRSLVSFQSLDLAALRHWSGTIGELRPVSWRSLSWLEWCSGLLLLVPLLWWRRGRGEITFLLLLLLVTFLLTLWQARWSYFFASIFLLLVPAILQCFRRTAVGVIIFLLALYPTLRAWDRRIDAVESGAREETVAEVTELHALSGQLTGPFLAPWWQSPALSYWSRQSGIAGTSHESLPGIVSAMRFYAATEDSAALAMCQERQVRWVVSYDAERVAGEAAAILGYPVTKEALCNRLDRNPTSVPNFLKLRRQTAHFKLYEVLDFPETIAPKRGIN